MNPSQIRLVQNSFAQLEPDMVPLTDLLYARWFQLDPGVRGRLPLDLDPHKQELGMALRRQVEHLSESTSVGAARLGQCHDHHEFSPREFLNLGAAMLWTLEQALGEAFTRELADAWFAFYMQLVARACGVEHSVVFRELSPPPAFENTNSSDSEF